jgi:opacity protein-like surface antigen
MKKAIIAVLSAVAMTSAVGAAEATKTAEGAPAVLMADRYASEYEVVAVDQATRKVSLKAADGTVTTITAGPEVRNFAQVKKGDRVRVEYAQALTVSFKKGGGVRVKEETTDGARAAQGARPAGAIMREVHFVADIVKLDAKTGAITVKGADGRTIDAKVNDPKVLQGYAAGDQVEGTFLQVLAIGDIGPAAAPKK